LYLSTNFDSQTDPRKEDGLHILAVHMFSLSANVTSDEVYNSVQTSLTNCSSTSAHCGVLLHHQLTYHGITYLYIYYIYYILDDARGLSLHMVEAQMVQMQLQHIFVVDFRLNIKCCGA
jgi:hypothetical protein